MILFLFKQIGIRKSIRQFTDSIVTLLTGLQTENRLFC